MTNNRPYKRQDNNKPSLAQRWKAALDQKIEIQKTEQELNEAQKESSYYKKKVRQLAQKKGMQTKELLEEKLKESLHYSKGMVEHFLGFSS